MTRILYASFDAVPAPKGASRHIQALLNGLVSSGLAVDLVTLAPRGASGLPTAVRAHPMSASGAQNLLERADAFGAHTLQVAKATPHALWHVRDVWQGVPLALWRAQSGGHTPLIWEVNALPTIELPVHWPGLAQQPPLLQRLRRLEQYLMGQAERLVAISAVTARCLIDLGAEPGRIEVVPNGVTLSDYQIPASEEQGAEILYVGTLAPWQGLDTLMAALARLPQWVRLRVVGPPGRAWSHRLRGRAAALGVAGRVLFSPPVSPHDIPGLISRARLCVAPLDGSARNLLQGCCPLKLLEYAAAGKPIVASAIPVVEALFQHEKSAYLVPPDDVEAWSRALYRVLTDASLRRTLGLGARQQAEAWDWQEVHQAWRRIYEAVGVFSLSRSAYSS